MDNKNDGEKTVEIHSQLVPLLKRTPIPLLPSCFHWNVIL